MPLKDSIAQMRTPLTDLLMTRPTKLVDWDAIRFPGFPARQFKQTLALGAFNSISSAATSSNWDALEVAGQKCWPLLCCIISWYSLCILWLFGLVSGTKAGMPFADAVLSSSSDTEMCSAILVWKTLLLITAACLHVLDLILCRDSFRQSFALWWVFSTQRVSPKLVIKGLINIAASWVFWSQSLSLSKKASLGRHPCKKWSESNPFTYEPFKSFSSCFAIFFHSACIAFWVDWTSKGFSESKALYLMGGLQ